MSILELKVTADTTGLAAIKHATDQLRAVLATSRAANAADITALTHALKAESVQAKATAASLTKAAAATKANGVASVRSADLTKASLSQLASVTNGLSVSLRAQTVELQTSLVAMAGFTGALRTQAQGTQALAGVVSLLNKEFSTQVSLRTTAVAKTSSEVAAERSLTKSLADQLVVRGQLTAQEAKSLGVSTTLIEGRIAAESAALAMERQVLAARASLRAGYYAAQIAAEEKASSSWLSIQNWASSQGLAAEQRALAARASLRAGYYAAQIAAEEKAAVQGGGLTTAQLQKVSAAYVAGTISIVEYTAAANGVLPASLRAASGLRASAAAATTNTLALRDATRGVAAAAGSLWMAYGQVLPLLGAYAATAGTLKGIGLASEFEYQTKYLITVAEATEDFSVSLDEVRSKLLGIRDVADAPAVLAESVKELVKAGFTTTQSISEIENMSRTATAVQEDLGLVTKGVAGQFRAWNASMVGAERGVSSLTETANMMSYAALATATDFGELNQMLAYTTELGPLTNASFSEILASLGHMTNMGIRGTKSATALRTAMLRLQSPTKGLADDLANLSVPFTAFSESGEVKDLTTMFEDLNKSLTPLTEESRIRLLTELFGKRSGKAGVALAQAMSQAINEGKTSFRGLEKAIRDAGYAGEFTQKIFEELADTTHGQTELLKADVVRTFTESYYGANVAVRGLVDSLREAVADGSLQTLIDGAAMLATGLVNVVKYAIEFRGVLLGVASAYATLKAGAGLLFLIDKLKVATGLATAFNVVASLNPYVRLAALLIGVGVGLAAYVKSTGKAIHSQQELGGAAEAAARKAGDEWEMAAHRTRESWSVAAHEIGKAHLLEAKKIADLGKVGSGTKTIFDADWANSPESRAAIAAWKARGAEGEVTQVHPGSRGLLGGVYKPPAAPQPDLWSEAAKTKAAGTETMRTAEQRAVDEWKAQNDIAVHKQILQAKAALDQEALSRKISLLDAEHKAGLISEKAHLDQVRSLQTASIDQQIADQRILIKYAEDQEKAAEAALKTAANEDKLQYNEKLAKATAGVTVEMDKLAKLEAQKEHLPELFASEDTQRAKAFSDSLRSVTDATRDLRDSMEALPQLAIVNEGAAAYAEQLAALKKEEARGLRGMSDSGKSPEEVAQYKAVMAKKLSAAQAYYSAEQVLRTDSLSGAKKAFADYAYAANDSFSQMKGFTSNFFQGIEDAMVKFVQTGKLSFKDLADSIIADLVRIATQRAISGLIGLVVTAISPAAGVATTAASAAVANANGNVYTNSPGLSAYSGTIVDRPTMFANGGSVMGEAGPEAILPLKRGSDGKLGVSAGEGAGSTNIYQTIQVDARGGEQDLEARLNQAVREGAEKGFNLVLKDVRTRGPVYRGIKG